jgi:hypothetical protein
MRTELHIQRVFQRLWRDFPELWGMCSEWIAHQDATIPVVVPITSAILNQRIMSGEVWWVVCSSNEEFPKRWVAKIWKDDGTVKAALKHQLALNTWRVEYVVLQNQDVEQDLKIYKPQKGQTINDLCFNLKKMN